MWYPEEEEILRIRDVKNHIGRGDYEALLDAIKDLPDVDENTRILDYCRNGNYYVMFLRDGTKIRFGAGDYMEPDYPECIDMTISKKCNQGCPYCYLNCTPNGKEMDWLDRRNHEIINGIRPCTELAVNANIVDSNLFHSLNLLSCRGIFVNITVNQHEFVKHYVLIKKYHDLGAIHGVGISYTGMEPEFIRKVQSFGSDAVIHVIAGIMTPKDWVELSHNGLNLLILGYKDIGRGKDYRDETVTKRIKMLEEMVRLYYHVKDGSFRSVAFDGLSIKQLHVKDWLGQEKYDEMYAGDEGAYTFYLDMVDRMYSVSSIDPNLKPIGDKSIEEMFNDVRVPGLHV